MQRLLDDAPPGVREGLGALQEIFGGKPIINSEAPIDAEFHQIVDRTPSSVVQVQPEPPSPVDEQEHALNTLPEVQKKELNAFSKELSAKFADGASSLVDQGVIAMLQRLPKSGEDQWWKLILSGREGWKALAAEGKETAARAKLRSSIADTAITIANLGEEEMEREVFQTFISTLKRSMGDEGIQVFCEEHNMDVPP